MTKTNMADGEHQVLKNVLISCSVQRERGIRSRNGLADINPPQFKQLKWFIFVSFNNLYNILHDI